MHGDSSRSEVGERPFPDQLGGTDTLAATFAVADRWFALVFCQIQPNWRYLVAATPANMVDDILSETSFGCLRDDFRPPRCLAQCVAELPRKLCAGQRLFLGDVIRGDFSSILILAMVERKSSLLLFTHRAAAAVGLADLLDLTQPAFADPSTHPQGRSSARLSSRARQAVQCAYPRRGSATTGWCAGTRHHAAPQYALPT